jgi:uncharacterized HhH-GPD family protein
VAKSDFYITGKPDIDNLLRTDPLALVLGMLLDQQVPMEWAFASPARLRERLGHLDATRIAAMTPDEFIAVFCAKPALHRFPASMGKRAHDLCVHVTEEYGGDAGKIWKGVRTGDALFARVRALPGFGQEKAQIFTALLAKRFGKQPPGWEHAAGVFSDAVPRSVADISSAESFARVRAFKKQMKAEARDKPGRVQAVH